MPAQEQSLKFEDLLATVQESERGRWFVAEFEARLRKSETASIFSAISKLESVIASQAQGGLDAALVARARTAIASARREIAALDQGRQQLSDEGRLFAKLADMARSAFTTNDPGATLVNAGVSRALLLVDQLDQDFAAGVLEQPRLSAPQSPPAAVQAKPSAPDVERGARLVIRKAGEAPTAAPASAIAADAPAASVPQQPEKRSEPATPPAPAAEVSPLAAAPAKQSRVVIIRRKPEELLDVPLMDESSGATAA
jgi:hypothetical protein